MNYLSIDALPFTGKESYNFKRALKRVTADEKNAIKAIRGHVHSWILWKENKRSGNNFESFGGMAFDIDKLFSQTPTPSELLRAAECVKYNFPEWRKFYIYPSWSGTGLHIEIPLSISELSLKKEAYEDLYKYYFDKLSHVFEGVDESCKDLARIIYPANPKSCIILSGKGKQPMNVGEKLIKAITKILHPTSLIRKNPPSHAAFHKTRESFEDHLDTSKLTYEGSRHINCLKDMVYVANCPYYSLDKKEEIFQKIMDASTLPEKEKQDILTSVKRKYMA